MILAAGGNAAGAKPFMDGLRKCRPTKPVVDTLGDMCREIADTIVSMLGTDEDEITQRLVELGRSDVATAERTGDRLDIGDRNTGVHRLMDGDRHLQEIDQLRIILSLNAARHDQERYG